MSSVAVERRPYSPIVSKLATPPMPLTAPWSNAGPLVSTPLASSTTSTSRNLIDELPLLITSTCMSTLKSHGLGPVNVSHRASPSDARPSPHPTFCPPRQGCICQARMHCCTSPENRRLADPLSHSVPCRARLRSRDPEAPAHTRN